MVEISITALISVLLLLVEHWAPTRLWLGRKLPALAAYILGVLALITPLTGLLVYWGEQRVILAMWIVVISGGAAVILAYMVDAWLIYLRLRSRYWMTRCWQSVRLGRSWARSTVTVTSMVGD